MGICIGICVGTAWLRGVESRVLSTGEMPRDVVKKSRCRYSRIHRVVIVKKERCRYAGIHRIVIKHDYALLTLYP